MHKKHYFLALSVAMFFSLYLLSYKTLLANPTSTFNQTINAGVLSVDIVNGSYVSVANPSVSMNTVNTPTVCRTGPTSTTGILGTVTEQIYVDNPDQADNGWTVSIAASSPTATWDAGPNDFDFNDPGTLTDGCTDTIVDADSFAGQMTIDPSGGTLANGQCGGCTTTGVTLGTPDSFVQGTVDDISVLSASSGSNDVADYTLRGVDISQTIPAGQAAGTYSISLTLSIIAN